jgi:hypothetical protein
MAGSPSSRVTPYSSTAARVILSMPGAPLLLRTANHARHRTSLRQILSYSAWNLRPGSALAARYSACCKARTGSALRRNRLWRDALEEIDKIPDEIRHTAEVRAAVGDFYRDCLCHAHASQNSTWRHALRSSASWLCSGGPFRKKVFEWETKILLRDLERRPAFINQVNYVGLGKLQRQQLRLQLERSWRR